VGLSFHFPVRIVSRHREARLILNLSCLCTLWEAGYAVLRLVQLRAGHVLYRPAWSDYALLLFLLWAPLSFYRQMCALSPGGSGWARWVKPFLLPIPDAATRCGGLAAKINSANRVFASPGRQQVGASIKLSGSEKRRRICSPAPAADTFR